MSRKVFAAVDIGTNSTRVLVGEPLDGGGVRQLARRMRITRLGEGVDLTGSLSESAVDRTVDALTAWRAVVDEYDIAGIRVVATSAARDASNREDLFSAVRELLGVEPELLSGEEEGRLSFLGATSGMEMGEAPLLVADIGGGSTELVVGSGSPSGVFSLDVGCVRISERFLHHDPPLPEELSAALEHVGIELDHAMSAVPEISEARGIVGLAGTVTSVAAIEMGLEAYDRDAIHHFVLTKSAAEDVFRTLATESKAERLGNPGLEAERADVIVGGCVILVKLLRTLGLDEVLVSEADILDGLVMAQA